MALKAGTVANFSSSLAEAMDNAFQQEWLALKGIPLPTQGQDDRRMLFAAIAQGLFVYLKANEDLLISTLTLRDDTGIGTNETYAVTQLELNL